MKKFKLFYVIILISVFLGTLINASSALAKFSKFQTSLLRDCRVYGELYEGIECRNASFSEVPICSSDEEIVTSPRKNKLCCCIKLEEESDEINNVEGDCRDVGCENLSGGSICSAGFSLQLFDGGGVSCCCSNSVTLSECQVIGCAGQTGGKGGKNSRCTEGFTTLQFGTSINIGGPSPSGVSTPCCCPTSSPAIDRVTCSIRNCEEPASDGTSCSSGLSLSEVFISINDNVERSIPCCCNTTPPK